MSMQRLWIIVLLSTFWLAGCAGLPPRGTPPASQAYTDTANTALAKLAAASRPATETAPSGFRLLPTGEFAFNARIGLARRAERSLDVQYYHLRNDRAGHLLLRELRDAAERGVRVRLLVDDFYAAEIDELLRGLSSYEHVEVRYFNPLPLRSGSPVVRLLLSPGDFERHNHRMHNKLFVADNAMAIYGGRNIADEYFMSSPEANFIDMDMISTGQVVRDLSAVFDNYWNSEAVWPLQALLGRPADTAVARAQFDSAVRDAAPVVPDYHVDPMGLPPVEQQLDAGRLTQIYASAKVHADPPSKALEPPHDRPTEAMQGLLNAISTNRQRVTIISPYFVPTEIGLSMMRIGAEHGSQTVLFTNSLATTDEPLVHHHYSRYRAEMLKLGVHIYEFNPVGTQRTRGFGAFGASTPRLHAKVTVIDRRLVVVGSVNLDARSAIGNTEMGVVIDSPALTEALLKVMESSSPSTMYKLRLAADGHNVEWLSLDEQGRGSIATEEPGLTAWLRFKLWLQSLFVSERLL